MDIPGHAPRPTAPPDPDRRHFAAFHRDAGLERISSLTKWTLAGGLAVTAGFAIVPAVAAATAPHVPSASGVGQVPTQSPTAVTAPPSTTPTAPTTAPTTAVPAPPPVDSGGSGGTVQTVPQTVPPTVAPTLPPQPPVTYPQTTVAPPVVVSGGS